VQAFTISLCDPGSAVTLNISYFDLQTFLGISTTSNYVIQYYASIPANMKTAVFNFPGNYSSEFCIKPAGSTIYASIINGLINKTNYVVTSYFVTNATRTNVTENVSLYMTPLTMGQLTNITIEIVDQDENALQNHIIQAWFYNSANNTYLLVDADLTDINGKVRFELNTFNTMYRFLVYNQEGKLILTTITFKLLETSYRFIIPLVKYDMLQQIQNFGNFMYYNLTYNNMTGLVKSDIWDAQNLTSQVCTRVRKLEPISNNTWLLDGCSLNKSAHFFLNISPYGNGTFQAMVYAYTNGTAPTPYTIGTLDVIVGLLQNIIFRSEGLLLTFFVVLLLGGIGMTGSPALLIISVLVAIGFMVISGMFVMGWGVLLGIIFAGILLVLKSKS